MRFSFFIPVVFIAAVLRGADAADPAPAALPAEASKSAGVKPAAPPAVDPRALLFETDPENFDATEYARTVESLISGYERETGRKLAKGGAGKVALKISTQSGAGLSTPKALVEAVSSALERRGFARADIFLLDQSESTLRQAGYLPAIPKKDDFNHRGSPVLALDTGKHYDMRPDSKWVWPSALPSKDIFPKPDDFSLNVTKETELSRLPMPLIREVDFWINLPVVCDSPALGVSGVMSNATIQNISNARRFQDSPANAAKAAVEIAAIPELSEKMIFSIVSLQSYQFAGGPSYDAAFTLSEKKIFLSANPVVLDYMMWKRINAGRAALNLKLIEPEPPIFLAANSGQIRLGSCRADELKRIRVK